MSKTFFYVLILIVLVMLVVDLVVVFMNKPPYEVVYYSATYEYEFSPTATFTTTTRLVFKNEDAKSKYVEALSQGATEVVDKYFENLGQKIKRPLKVKRYDYRLKDVDERTLEINETLVLTGAAKVERREGVKEYDTSLGDIRLNAVGDSQIKMLLPADATVVSANPKPSKQFEDGGKLVLVWKSGEIKEFPRVVYREK